MTDGENDESYPFGETNETNETMRKLWTTTWQHHLAAPLGSATWSGSGLVVQVLRGAVADAVRVGLAATKTKWTQRTQHDPWHDPWIRTDPHGSQLAPLPSILALVALNSLLSTK